MNIYDSYNHIHCMKVAVRVKLKRCLPMKFSNCKNPHCCSAHGCQLFLLIPAKCNTFYAKSLLKIPMLQTYFESANRPLLSNKKQWLIATKMFSERNDVMRDARHAPSRSLHWVVITPHCAEASESNRDKLICYKH